MKILITGATGYIGSTLMGQIEKSGHEVIVATRTHSSSFKSWIFFDLNRTELLQVPSGVDSIIHLAANTKNIRVESKQELITAKFLINESKKIHAKFIFLSSQASGEYAYSQYGRNKWKIENEVLAAGGIVVRPGLVYGGSGVNGLFGVLVKIVQEHRILPSFYPSPYVQPIHVDDLCLGIIRLFNAKSKIYSIAAVKPIPFKVFLQEIINAKKIGLRVFVPTPLFLIKVISCLVSRKSTIGGWVDRLLSLASTIPMCTQEDLNELNLELRDLSVGMHGRKAFFRRELLMEGRLLMIYVGDKSSGFSLRRYVKAIESCCKGVPLFLPKLLLRAPCLFSILNLNELPTGLNKADIQWRIDAVTLLSEATVKGGLKIFDTKQSPDIFRKLTAMFLMTIKELGRKALSFFLSPALKLFLKFGERRVYVQN